MSIKSKFTLLTLIFALIGAFVFGFLSYLAGQRAMTQAAFDELTAIRTAQKARVTEYFDSVKTETLILAESPLVSMALRDFNAGWQALERASIPQEAQTRLKGYYETDILPEFDKLLASGDATYAGFNPGGPAAQFLQNAFVVPKSPSPTLAEFDRYAKAHDRYHGEFSFIKSQFDFYDIFLIDHKTGNIIYSVRKEPDFATSIFTGPYRGSQIAELADRVVNDPAQNSVHLSDFEFYLPSRNLPALFVGAPVYDDGQLLGLLVIQLTIKDLDRIMTYDGLWKEVGLKGSGETYLVGDDFLMRSNSRFAVEEFDQYLGSQKALNVPERIVRAIERGRSAILVQKVETDAVRTALSGQSDTKLITDYRGVDVLSAYAPLGIEPFDWVILAEIDADEALKPVNDMLRGFTITSGIVIPLIAILAAFFSGVLMRPLVAMQNAAKAFLGGDEKIRFAAEGKDEFARLGGQMNAVLDTAEKRLEDANAARAEVGETVQRLMPNAVAQRYRAGETRVVNAAKDASAAVLFLTPSQKLNSVEGERQARDLYELLDDRLDSLSEAEGVDLLNQAGMHYVAFCNLTSTMRNHAERLLRFCAKAQSEIEAFNAEHDTDISCAIGLHSGEMFGALIGNINQAYEIWGPVVHVAFDLAHDTPPGQLTLSKETAEAAHLAAKSKALSVALKSGQSIKVQRVDAAEIKKVLRK